MDGSVSMIGWSASHLAIEHAQRIGFGAALAIAAHLRRDVLQLLAQRARRTAARQFVIADGIDQQLEAARGRRP